MPPMNLSRRALLLTLAQALALPPALFAATPQPPRVPSLKPAPARKAPGASHVQRQEIPKVPNLASPNNKLQGLKDADMVELTEIDPTIIVDIQFSRPENPFHYQFFTENTAYVRYATARKIAAVQRDLRKRGLRLKIWSAYRPMPVQVKMYDIVGRNGDWVSDPYNDKSKKAHVRGVAIDCTLVDKSGKELAMPTSYLDFKNFKKMWADYMDLPPQVIRNRNLLRDVMLDHGMSGYSKEWWHFQDNKIMQYPAIVMSDFPELDKRILVDEVYKIWPDFEAKMRRKAQAPARHASAAPPQAE